MKLDVRFVALALTVAAWIGCPPASSAAPVPAATAQTPAPTITPEFLAALRSGESRRILEALDHGASVQARDARGNTPLMIAGLYGNVGSLRVLLGRGADVNATNHAGATALMRAAIDPEKIALLLRHGAEVNVQSASGNTPLMLAARTADSHRAVRLLLEHGADPQATNRFGATALMAATAGGDPRSVNLLLRAGANPNARPNLDEPGFLFGGGRTPLMWAAFRGHLENLKRLVDAGADVNTPGLLGTALAQATWSDQHAAVAWLLDHGAQPQTPGFVDGYTPLHWAASTERPDATIVSLLLRHGADPNAGGGEPVDAFLGTPQTPLMLARRHGNHAAIDALKTAGATQETPDWTRTLEAPARSLPVVLGPEHLRSSAASAVVPLQITALDSKQAFLRHASRQDCTSCHQQHLPLAAISHARKAGVPVDLAAEKSLVHLVQEGSLKDPELDEQPLFHPDAVMTKGYELLAYAAADLPADANTFAWVHHLTAVQGRDGQWHNNLPRPPIQTGDIGATALAIQALQRYPLPGRSAELARRVSRARQWLWKSRADDTDGRVYQLLGLAWAGESPAALRPLAQALVQQQRTDGGWGQLANLPTDAYATGQAVYALRFAAGLRLEEPAVQRGLRFLVQTQLADGTWHVRRRAFPFQPTMNSGFPHGRDSWISAAGTSWAVMALTFPEPGPGLAASTKDLAAAER